MTTFNCYCNDLRSIPILNIKYQCNGDVYTTPPSKNDLTWLQMNTAVWNIVQFRGVVRGVLYQRHVRFDDLIIINGGNVFAIFASDWMLISIPLTLINFRQTRNDCFHSFFVYNSLNFLSAQTHWRLKWRIIIIKID